LESRARSLWATKDIVKESLTARWEVAHDICSVAACNQAFEDCQEGKTYDLGEIYFFSVHPGDDLTVVMQKLYGPLLD
jgi:hypothetical protein